MYTLEPLPVYCSTIKSRTSDNEKYLAILPVKGAANLAAMLLNAVAKIKEEVLLNNFSKLVPEGDGMPRRLFNSFVVPVEIAACCDRSTFCSPRSHRSRRWKA